MTSHVLTSTYSHLQLATYVVHSTLLAWIGNATPHKQQETQYEAARTTPKLGTITEYRHIIITMKKAKKPKLEY